MNAALNLAIGVAGPMVVMTVIALVRWLVDRDAGDLGRRLHHWSIWAAMVTYALIASAMTLSMAVNGDSYAVATAVASAALFIGLPLGTWAWQRAGGRGLPVVIALAAAALCALAIAVSLDPQRWWEIQNSDWPIASVVALAIGASMAVWGRRVPVPAGAALLVVGLVPLGISLLASADADLVLEEMFAPMPMFALLGLLLLAAARLQARSRPHDVQGTAPDWAPDRTMAA